MTVEQVSPYIFSAVLLAITKAYDIFTAGQRFDDRVKKHIADAAEARSEADDLRKEMAQKDFEHMASDIKRISESMTDILRMLRESVATKQDLLQLEARADSSEEAIRNLNDEIRRLEREISKIRENCARH